MRIASICESRRVACRAASFFTFLMSFWHHLNLKCHQRLHAVMTFILAARSRWVERVFLNFVELFPVRLGRLPCSDTTWRHGAAVVWTFYVVTARAGVCLCSISVINRLYVVVTPATHFSERIFSIRLGRPRTIYMCDVRHVSYEVLTSTADGHQQWRREADLFWLGP